MTAPVIGLLALWHIAVGAALWLLWRCEARLRSALVRLASCADDTERRWRAGWTVLHMEFLRHAADDARRTLGPRRTGEDPAERSRPS